MRHVPTTGAQRQGGTSGADRGGSGMNSPDSVWIWSSMLTKKKEVKVKAPPNFSCDRELADDFLKAVKLNLKMNKHMYDTDERKILYTLSYMNGGMVQTWKNMLDDILNKETNDEEEGLTFATFEEKFRERFEPFDKVT
ncbi:hypothetical protein MPER_00332, partial [Moniliophthora perniciosa FA553]